MAFGALSLFVVLAATMNILVLQQERRHFARAMQVYGPLLESMMSMDGTLSSMLAATRGYTISQQTQFLSQYDEAIRRFELTYETASSLATEQRDRALIDGMREHYLELRKLSDEQVTLTREGRRREALDVMLEAAKIRRSAHDFAGAFTQRERRERLREQTELDGLRLALTLLLVIVSVAILFVGIFAVLRVERSLEESVARQVKRTEEIVAGMADGVMLVDREGKVAYINPAGVRLLDNAAISVPIEEQAEVYGFRTPDGGRIAPMALPAARAISSGREVKDATIVVERPDGRTITVSMSAVALTEEGRVSGAIVNFRDVTERRRLEKEMKLQAERAQTLADAGAFFASNIDPVWVTQAIAERVAEDLGDWAAVVLREPDSTSLRVASIYHRDISSLGLAWAFVYRQPLVVGEGIFGQVIASGYPSLISNLEP
jgi:PAS domain-containing protein